MVVFYLLCLANVFLSCGSLSPPSHEQLVHGAMRERLPKLADAEHEGFLIQMIKIPFRDRPIYH